ncbi:MAG: sugar transferase [Bacteroidales bacterium]|nr:sugar transferase [Bacteroidales bacterium]
MKSSILYIGNNPSTIQTLRNKLQNISLVSNSKVISAFQYLKIHPETHMVIFEVTTNYREIIASVKYFKKYAPHPIQILVLVPNNRIKTKLELCIADQIINSSKGQSALIRGIKKARKLINSNSAQALANRYTVPFWKRSMDIVLSSLAILILSPFFLLVALAIRFESKGKVFYAAQRVGAGYKVFNFYKFRSMYTNADKRIGDLTVNNQYDKQANKEEAPDFYPNDTILYHETEFVSEQMFLAEKKKKQENTFFKMANDPRITKVGRFIRNTSIDELPQLFNILKGDMSIVGNRPLPLYEAELLTSDRWSKRFLSPAGLTGLWQVTKRGGANKMSADERKQLDIDYGNSMSFWNDLKIMWKTIPAMIQHENV